MQWGQQGFRMSCYIRFLLTSLLLIESDTSIVLFSNDHVTLDLQDSHRVGRLRPRFVTRHKHNKRVGIYETHLQSSVNAELQSRVYVILPCFQTRFVIDERKHPTIQVRLTANLGCPCNDDNWTTRSVMGEKVGSPKINDESRFCYDEY